MHLLSHDLIAWTTLNQLGDELQAFQIICVMRSMHTITSHDQYRYASHIHLIMLVQMIGPQVSNLCQQWASGCYLACIRLSYKILACPTDNNQTKL